MKKRILLIMLAFMLIAASISACGQASDTTKTTGSTTNATSNPSENSDSSGSTANTSNDLYSGEKVNLKMMVWNQVEAYETLNQKLFEHFPEIKSKVDIEVVVGGDGDKGVAEKLRLLLASNEQLPDMVRLNYTQFYEFATYDLLYDMSDAVSVYKDDIFDKVLDLMTYEGKILCLPQEVKPKIWYYRKDIFDECSIKVDEIKTVEDFIEAAGIIYKKTGKYIENYMPPENAYDLFMLLSGNGGRLSDENGNFICASDENVKRAFEIIKSYNDSGYFAPISEWSADWQAAFSQEILVSQLIASWMKQHLIQWVPEQAGKWVCALWPEEIRYGSDGGMGMWVVLKDSKTPSLSADILAKYSFDKDYRKEVFRYNGIIPPLKSAQNDPDYYVHDYFGEDLARVYFEALDYLAVYPYTPTQSMQQTIIMQYLDEYVNGNMTVEDALEAAQNDMINQIGNAWNQ